MANPQTTSEIEFEKSTREWIIGRVGLAGFYEIARIRRLESEGLLEGGSSLPVEFTTILSLMRQNGELLTIPPKNRKEFDNLLYKQRQIRNLMLEGEKNLVFESEGTKRLSRYSKMFKVFPDSAKLSEFDAHVFSSLYDRVSHFAGGNVGSMTFHKLRGKTETGHELVVYLFCDKSSLFEDWCAMIQSPSVPKRIFIVSGGNRLTEKDPMLAATGLLKAKALYPSHSGVVVGKQ